MAILSRKKEKHLSAILCMSFFVYLLPACSTSIMGIAVFPSEVDFSLLRVGMQQDELKKGGTAPNSTLSSNPVSYNSATKKWTTRHLETWVFKNSSTTRQFLYFENKQLAGWEELQKNPEAAYNGKWKDWPREH